MKNNKLIQNKIDNSENISDSESIKEKELSDNDFKEKELSDNDFKEKEEEKDFLSDDYDDNNNNEKDNDYEDDDLLECYEEELDNNKKYKKINDEDRITMNRLTKYERAKILCARIQQIENGSKIMLNYEGDINKLQAIEIAELELKHKVIPIKVIRKLPNGDYEEWSISELI